MLSKVKHEELIERFLQKRPAGAWITILAITSILKIKKSSASRILRDLLLTKKIISEKILVQGKGQPTLAYQWDHTKSK